MEIFYSDNPQEIEEEKKKQECYRHYFPQLMGEKDETQYILLKNKQTEANTTENRVNKPKDQRNSKIRKIYNKAKVLGKEAIFAIENPRAALDIGAGVTHNASNISSNASRFATKGSVLSQTVLNKDMIDEGSETGAFRHTLWQANIASKHSGEIAVKAGNAHEIAPWTDLNIRRFNQIENADQTTDLLNNQIGRAIGNCNKNKTAKELALIVLDEFKNNGLYVSEQDEEGIWNIKKKKISEEKYNRLKDIFNTLNKYGFTEEEYEKIKKEEKRKAEALQISWNTMK